LFYENEELNLMLGDQLARFVIDYTIEIAPEKFKKFLKFVSNKTSCRNYKILGSNWQAKRYLADICYILEKAGLPSLTHADKSINPRKKLIEKSHLIPKSDKIINRKIINFDYKHCVIRSIKERARFYKKKSSRH